MTIELVLAVVAAAGSVWCWLASQTTVTVAPILPGEPQTTSVVYSPPLLFLMLLLATVCGRAGGGRNRPPTPRPPGGPLARAQ